MALAGYSHRCNDCNSRIRSFAAKACADTLSLSGDLHCDIFVQRQRPDFIDIGDSIITDYIAYVSCRHLLSQHQLSGRVCGFGTHSTGFFGNGSLLYISLYLSSLGWLCRYIYGTPFARRH